MNGLSGLALRALLGTALWFGSQRAAAEEPPERPRAQSRHSAADDRARKRAARRAERRAKRAARQRAARASAPARGASEAAAPASAATAPSPAAPVDSEIVKEGDTSVKVMKFSGLGIEGRLRSPQLVYFVDRVRAEFAHPTLPHRSFLPELAQSAEREPVR